MLNIQNVFLNPALLLSAIGLVGMLVSFATNARLCFKAKIKAGNRV